MSRLSRVAIVAGGGTLIGAAIAVRLARSGSAVAIVAGRADRLAQAAVAIRADGGHVLGGKPSIGASAAPAQEA